MLASENNDNNIDVFVQKLPSRIKLFWFCQLSGWAVYALLTEIMIKLSGDEPWRIHLPHLVMDTLCGIAITLALRWLYRQSSVSQHYVVAKHVVLLLLAALLWTQFKWYTLQALFGSWWVSMTWFDFGTWTSASLTMLATWTAGYYGIKNYLTSVEERERADKALHLANEAQLKMLRYQLNPHFMFNSINAICTLILKNENTHAVSMLEQLCDFLRYSLYTDPLSTIPVAEEIDILNNYLDIEKGRFQSRLQVNIQADNGCQDILIPSLIVQPLVENVLKHGMIPNQTIVIKVNFESQNQGLLVTVKDNGKGFTENTPMMTTDSESGIGLSNCRQRLKLIYHGDATLDTGNNAGGGAWVKIWLPVKEGARDAAH
ncbi:sensor histidine kinase [Alteromonas confluentis]|uniref:sensor histidine kinase n=1 Tax=Alteromonas confluentis TaxID=1656094 RepID=UPI000A85C974|nr:histidine kinase [Alteromonas confluentis]